jgi:predicted RNase H-like HicB family nuclease
MVLRSFLAVVIQDQGDGPDDGYDVVFPDFPGCVSSGESRESAEEAAGEALSIHVEEMLRLGEAIPLSGPHRNLPDWLVQQPIKVVGSLMLSVELPEVAQRA